MTSSKRPAIEVQDLTVAYKEKPVLWDIDFEIPKGILLAVVGPNGAGKTTLIKAMLGLITPATGSVTFNGKKRQTQKKKIAYVPQRNSVDWDFPTHVMDVVLMGRYGHLGWFKRPRNKDHALAEEALEKVGMTAFSDTQINQLSGGQQQRIFLARALVQHADIYFLDEPFVGVDALTESAIVALLKTLRQQGKTLMVVHHDLHTLKEYYDWSLLINVRKIALGPTSDVLTQENLDIAYGGRTAFLDKDRTLNLDTI
jgi:manganese/zinc/iron transport system ATP- binding protein